MALVVVTFFLASAGASAAYLTVSEIFPMETRALAIAFFYAIGTAVGGITGPLLFGHLIGSGRPSAGRRSRSHRRRCDGPRRHRRAVLRRQGRAGQLEDIAQPLTAEEAEEGGDQEGGGQEGEGEQQEETELHPERRRAERLRADAQEARARGAEHRAAFQELQPRADGGDERARERMGDEELLSEVAELRARCYDEQAACAEQRAEADEAGEDEAARTAALQQAAAADERARSWRSAWPRSRPSTTRTPSATASCRRPRPSAPEPASSGPRRHRRAVRPSRPRALTRRSPRPAPTCTSRWAGAARGARANARAPRRR